MTRSDRKYHAAGLLLFVSAVVHVPILLLAFQAYGIQMATAIVLWVLLGFGLMRGSRWIAYPSFIGMLIGAIVALSGALTMSGIVAAAFWLIVILDLVVAVILFGILWSDRPETAI